MWSMFEIIQKLAPAPPTGLYSHVAPINCHGLFNSCLNIKSYIISYYSQKYMQLCWLERFVQMWSKLLQITSPVLRHSVCCSFERMLEERLENSRRHTDSSTWLFLSFFCKRENNTVNDVQIHQRCQQVNGLYV